MIICVDFDGTIVTHEYPRIGEQIEGAIEKLQYFQDAGHKIILWTMRSGERLDEAVEYLNSNGINLFGVNENPEQHKWTDSPKAYAHRYIDDAAYGCPLIFGLHERPYVDWSKISI